jgi:hypothetical protein
MACGTEWKSSALSASPDSVGARRLLSAGSILWRFLRIGYAPDVQQCAEEIDRLLPGESVQVLQKLQSLERAVRSLDRPTVRGRAPVETESQPASPTEAVAPSALSEPGLLGQRRGGQQLRSTILSLAAAAGPDLSAIPLARLRALAMRAEFFADNEHTTAELDDTARISFRWYRHDPVSPDLQIRFLPRVLLLSPISVAQELDGLQGFGWRDHNSTAQYAYFAGTFGAADLRLAGTAGGIWEASIASENADRARQLLFRIVEALAQAAPAVPDGGIPEVVRQRLSLSELTQQPPYPDYWQIRSGS